MNRFKQILLFLLVNLAGSFVAALIFNGAIVAHLFPDVPDGPLKQQLAFAVVTLTPWVSLAMVLVSLGYFFTTGEARKWLLLTPLYIPALYSLLLLVYFNFILVR